MRWLFVLLLLVNGVFFVWQNHSMPRSERTDVVAQGVSRLRLLTDIDASLLLPRDSGAGFDDAAVAPAAAGDTSGRHVSAGQSQASDVVEALSHAAADPSGGRQCQVISGLGREHDAQQLLGDLRAIGLAAQLRSGQVFELIVVRAAENAAALEPLAVPPAERQLHAAGEMVLGRYATRVAAEAERTRLAGVVASRISPAVDSDLVSEVWVEDDSRVETSSKINMLASFFPGKIKIEKKSCKGVASTGVRD